MEPESPFNLNVRIKYCAKQVIDLPSENLKKKGETFKLIYQFSELNFKFHIGIKTVSCIYCSPILWGYLTL